MKKTLFVLLSTSIAWSHPFPDETKVPVDTSLPLRFFASPGEAVAVGLDCIRINIQWSAAGEIYSLARVVRETSGTEALKLRAAHRDVLGSYRAELWDRDSGAAVLFSSVGTGAEFRKLTREMSFRFPLFEKTLELRLFAESPSSGRMEEVLRRNIDPTRAELARSASPDIEVRKIASATHTPALKVTLYAEGYSADRAEKFWSDAEKTARALKERDFPGADRFELVGVFAPSHERLGPARSFGSRVPMQDTFLGLYYPFWASRVANRTVYPTSEERYRRALASAAYDYPLVLVDSSDYFGVGNYNEITAVPVDSNKFQYLLFHELGHFFGLNEEYDTGETELLFAASMSEPWSQNMTFTPTDPKWSEHVIEGTPLPTPSSYWHGRGRFGSYRGGYGGSSSRAYKPGLGCIMDHHNGFCPICQGAIETKIGFDLGG